MKNISGKTATKSFLDEFFGKSPTRMVIFDPENGAICDANKAYLDFHGYTRRQIIGKTSVDLGQASSEVLQEVLKQIKEKGRVDNLFVKTTGKNNEQKYVLVYAVPIVLKKKLLFLSFSTDISQSVMTAKHIKDDLLKIYDSCDYEGVILVDGYHTEKASIIYSNKMADILLKQYPLNKLLKDLKGNESLLLKINSKPYFLKIKGNNYGSDTQLIIIYSWPESINVRQIMKKHKLSPRQSEIALLIIDGYSNQMIAEKLNLSEHTIKDHVKDIFSIINIHNRSELFPTLYNFR
jgi:PAS domain S-box-containing protein